MLVGGTGTVFYLHVWWFVGEFFRCVRMTKGFVVKSSSFVIKAERSLFSFSHCLRSLGSLRSHLADDRSKLRAMVIPSTALRRCAATSLRGRLPRRLNTDTSRPHNHRATIVGAYSYASQTSSFHSGGTSHPSGSTIADSASAYQAAAAAAAAMALIAASGGLTLSSSSATRNEAPDAHQNLAEPHPGAHPMPSKAGTDNICDGAPSLEEMPVYRSTQVAKNDGSDGRPIWMSYGGVVYDVTGFISNHPGGSEKILLASGGVSLPVAFCIVTFCYMQLVMYCI